MRHVATYWEADADQPLALDGFIGEGAREEEQFFGYGNPHVGQMHRHFADDLEKLAGEIEALNSSDKFKFKSGEYNPRRMPCSISV